MTRQPGNQQQQQQPLPALAWGDAGGGSGLTGWRWSLCVCGATGRPIWGNARRWLLMRTLLLVSLPTGRQHRPSSLHVPLRPPGRRRPRHRAQRWLLREQGRWWQQEMALRLWPWEQPAPPLMLPQLFPYPTKYSLQPIWHPIIHFSNMRKENIWECNIFLFEFYIFFCFSKKIYPNNMWDG